MISNNIFPKRHPDHETFDEVRVNYLSLKEEACRSYLR